MMLNAIIVCLYVVSYIAIGIVFASLVYRIDKDAVQQDMAVPFTIFWPAFIIVVVFLGFVVGIGALVKKLSGR